MIREATPADFEAFAALEKEVQRMHFDARPDTFIEAPFDGDIAKYRADFEASLQNECVKIFVYEENGDVLGYCKTEAWDYDQHPIYRDVVVLNISSIGVDEKARGRKIGTRLFNQAKAYAAEIGAARFMLSVSDFNKQAIKFYEQLGMTAQTVTMEMTKNAD